MLAGLYAAAERHEEAAAIFAALLEETPDALHLWPDLVDALARAGKRREAEEARKRGLAALAAAPEENEPLRKRLEEIEIR
jgi:predicted Zn-dependent protease